MITTEYEFHGPEFEYLIHGYNGIVSKNNIDAYVDQIVRLIESPQLITSLKSNCLETSYKYTVEKMVTNFVSGIKKVLE